MTKMYKSKALSIVVAIALVFSVFAGFTITSSAATYTMTVVNNNGINCASGDTVNISSATELGYLYTYVVTNGHNTSGVTFKLKSGFALSGSWTTPIGNAAHPFAGTFDGNGNTISGLSITSNAPTTYVGLFGYATGPIENLAVTGSINLSTNSAEYVGGIVGYTRSDIYNCNTNVSVSAINSLEVGGIAGAIENTATSAITSPFHIQACYAKGNITAQRRVGGVVGAVYCGYNGNVIVDNCYYASGISTRAAITVTYSSKLWSGGVVGYCQGYITNCYAVASLATQNGGHYISGVAGIVQGASGAVADMYNSYASVSVSGDTGYDRPLYGSDDNSNTMPIYGCLYDSTLAGAYSNTPGTGSNGWAYWTNSGYGTTAQMKGTGNVTVYNTSNGGGTQDTSKTVLDVLGSAYASDTSTKNDGYPVLKWQNGSALPTYVAGNGTTNGDDGTGIYLDGVNGKDTNAGTSIITPVKTVSKALQLAEAQSPDYNIYVINTVTLGSSDLQLSSGAYTGAIERSKTFGGILFSVPTGVTSTLTYVTVDGNLSNVSASSPVFSVVGTLAVSTGAALQNCNGQEGGAVSVAGGGTLNMSNGTIFNCTAQRGGAVDVLYNGTFNLSGGTITSCAAVNVGGAVCARGAVNMTGGTIGASGYANSANYGGGIALMFDDSTHCGSLAMNAGTVTYNTAVLSGGTGGDGAGVYVGHSNCTISVSGSASITYNAASASGGAGGVCVVSGVNTSNITKALITNNTPNNYNF